MTADTDLPSPHPLTHVRTRTSTSARAVARPYPCSGTIGMVQDSTKAFEFSFQTGEMKVNTADKVPPPQTLVNVEDFSSLFDLRDLTPPLMSTDVTTEQVRDNDSRPRCTFATSFDAAQYQRLPWSLALSKRRLYYARSALCTRSTTNVRVYNLPSRPGDRRWANHTSKCSRTEARSVMSGSARRT